MTEVRAFLAGFGCRHRACGARRDDAVSTCALGLIKGLIGEFEKQIDPVGGFRVGGDADRCGQSIRRLAVVLGAVFLESGADLFRPPGRLAERALRQE